MGQSKCLILRFDYSLKDQLTITQRLENLYLNHHNSTFLRYFILNFIQGGDFFNVVTNHQNCKSGGILNSITRENLRATILFYFRLKRNEKCIDDLKTVLGYETPKLFLVVSRISIWLHQL